MPYVIEPAAGADRATLAFLVDAYDEDVADGEARTVLRLHPQLAPIKAAVFPLLRKDGQPEKAHEVYDMLRPHFSVDYDQAGAIGRRYRRQDEIGTPYGITIDHQTLQDETVTLRDRDSMEQERAADRPPGRRARATPAPRPLEQIVSHGDTAARRRGVLSVAPHLRVNLSLLRHDMGGRVSKKVVRVAAKRPAARVKTGAKRPARRRAQVRLRVRRRHAPTATPAMKNLLGGKGANLAEMAGLGLPVPPGFTISTEVCTLLLRARASATRPALRDDVARHLHQVERLVGKRFGDPANPLLVSVRSGARASMPGMMDTILNLGLNDETVRGLIAAHRQPALRLRLLSPLRRRCTATSCSASSPRSKDEIDPVRGDPRAQEARARRDARHRADRRRPARAGRRVQGRDPRATRHRLPRGSARAAVGRHRRRVRLVEQRPRHRLSQAERHPRVVGHRRQRAGDGVRQPGRGLRHRRRLHARSGHRRERLLRRVPDERAGRGRRRRHAHAAADPRARARPIPRSTGSCSPSAARSSATTTT